MKPSVVLISSSDDDGDDERSLDEEESEDDDYRESDDEEENDVEKSDEEECSDDCDQRRRRVDYLHRGSNDLREPSLDECKAYFRKHGMRVSGTKEECIQRFKEHARLKDGRGESLYPVSSFSINCTGDACKGDVVLFKQNIKGVNVVGKRTVAGRIVKESYGVSKQQHTFTIEVLWSKRSKKLHPLSALLVKGRKLYKFGTFRQPWKNEAERSKVLGEKHNRGDEARHKRKLRQTDVTYNNNKVVKRQKVSQHSGPSQSKRPTQIDKQKSAKRRVAAPVKESLRFQKTELKRSTQPTFRSNPNLNTNPNLNMYSDYHRRQQEASSSFPHDRSLLTRLPAGGFRDYGHYSNGQRGANDVLYQPRGHLHYNYEQPIPGYWFH